MLELHFQTTAELVEIDLRPIDAKFAANPLGHGDTYPLFFGFYGCVLSVFDWLGRWIDSALGLAVLINQFGVIYLFCLVLVFASQVNDHLVDLTGEGEVVFHLVVV